MERIGVRAFRERLSSYLDRVERGEPLEITDRGRVVARLEPPQRSDDALDQLIDEGVVMPPRTRGGIDGLPLPRGGASTKGSDALDELREERF
jgi:prevent-host-death family protein